MSSPIYPKSLSSWVDRIDQVDTVWAADPNFLAGEIISLETTLGTMPQVEPSPPLTTATAMPVKYSTVSSRIHSAMSGALLPYVDLGNALFKLPKSGREKDSNNTYYNGTFNRYNQVNSNKFGMYNGSDVTIKAPGIYTISSSQSWSNTKTGYVMMMLVINASRDRIDRWDWSSYDPVSTDFGSTAVQWVGPLNKDDRIRIASQNATGQNPTTVTYANLRVQYIRDLP